MDGPRTQTEIEVEAALLINEGGVQCVPVVFARLLRKDAHVELEDPMDVRWFRPGDVARLDSR